MFNPLNLNIKNEVFHAVKCLNVGLHATTQFTCASTSLSVATS